MMVAGKARCLATIRDKKTIHFLNDTGQGVQNQRHEMKGPQSIQYNANASQH